jgi:hypothetical protein
MRTRSIHCLQMITALLVMFSFSEANAAFSAAVGTPNLSFSISDYQPAPANVYVHNNGGRPYYMERDHRVYMKKRHHGHGYEKEKHHHEDNGRKHGHDKHNDH